MDIDTVSLHISKEEIGFLKSAIMHRAEYLIGHINIQEYGHQLEEEEQKQIEEAQLFLLKSQNDALQEKLDKIEETKKYSFELTPERIREMREAGFWSKKQDEEIKDIEMNEFQADIKEMIAKHTPIKRGRPVGSKNKEKANAK